MTMVRILSTPFSLQKGGNDPTEYEDAYYPAACGLHAAGRLSFAVADGATEALLSAQWANLLVKLYKRRWQDLAEAPQWLARAYKDWVRLKEDYVRRRDVEGRPIQWYEEPGLEAGAFATLLGVTFTSPVVNNSTEQSEQAEEQEPTPSTVEGGGTFEAVALGDSCLFQVREGALILQFPFTYSSEFNNRPLLISSNPARNGRIAETLRSVRGDFRPGDRFYLMTDALAAWVMRQNEADHTPWPLVEALGTDAPVQSPAEWITTLRETGQIRNDDVTCVRLQVM